MHIILFKKIIVGYPMEVLEVPIQNGYVNHFIDLCD